MLTSHQMQALQYLAAYQRVTSGRTPSMSEMAVGFNLKAHSGVSRLFDGLAMRGFIRKHYNGRRVEIIQPPHYRIATRMEGGAVFVETVRGWVPLIIKEGR